MERRQFLKNSFAVGIVTVLTPNGILFSCRSNSVSSLEPSFNTPPSSAKPYTWWHWINGNVTKDGITRDLEAMAKVGIGGFQTFSADSGIPSGPAEYLSPLWIDLMQHAAKEAGRLGLEFDMHNCMGWSSSGGSWITPELSMQQIVWSENYVEGGKLVSLKLRQPFKRLDYYKDALVLAFPSEDCDNALYQAKKITINGVPISAEEILKCDYSSGVKAISTDPSLPSYLLFEFENPVEIRSITINSTEIKESKNNLGDSILLEASNDGSNFTKITELTNFNQNIEIPSFAGFPVEKANYFRLMIPMARSVSYVRLSGLESINEWPFKANYPKLGKFNPNVELNESIHDEIISKSAINPTEVIDISKCMNENGELNWDAPYGQWTILRFGHTTTGVKNRPAEGKGLGLECDKFSSDAFDFHFNYMLEHVMPALKPLIQKGSVGMLIDSYEVDMQNWTSKMPQEFKARRGYDILNYLPVLTGRAVGNANLSERFLWDFRRTCADMMKEHYQGRFVELCKRNNIISSTEPYNHSPFEQMQAGAKMDVNLSEFWLKTPHFCHSIKLASSIQNMNGKQIVGAESFTGRPYYSKWQEYPFSMKAQGDFMFTRGINRFIFHRYAHQPHPTVMPGMTMGPWGFHFDRTNTWFFQGRKWLEYASRCQFMLQQGIFVGDVMCYTGDEAPGDDLSMGELRPDLPEGYGFQFANKDIILNRVRIVNGTILLPDGLSFSLMLLPGKKCMTIEVLRKLKELVSQGMILVGQKPSTIPSLTNFTENLAEFIQLVADIWGTDNNTPIDRKLGQGRVFSGTPIKDVIQLLGLKPDFMFTSKSGDAPINYIHRKTADGHIYFVANRRRFEEDIVCDFRVSGFEPELWDADSGTEIPISLYDTKGGITTIPLHLDPAGSLFVVFRKPVSNDRLISLTKNGFPQLGIQHFIQDTSKLKSQLVNNFTVSLWVKPETDELIPEELGQFTETTRYTSSYPVYPPPGKRLFGEGHTSFCLLVARNGVAVFEKEDENLQAVVIAQMPLSSWTHFAVVYQDGIPSLYVNGAFINKGIKSDKKVHPVIGQDFKNDKLFYYDGDLSRPEVFNEPFTESKIKAIVAKGCPVQVLTISVEPALIKNPSWLFWDNGQYEFKTSKGNSFKVSITEIQKPVELTGSWTVNFPSGLGAPSQIVLPELISLHTHANSEVKYFSGTATYSKTFKVNQTLIAEGKRVFLDLGRIAVIAEIAVNGKELEILWKPPYRLDITDIVKVGDNDLHIKVTNQWPNRLIGDEQLPAENEYGKFTETGAAIQKLPEWYQQSKPKPAGGRITFSTWQHFRKDSPLLESGLIGPVVIRNAIVKKILS